MLPVLLLSAALGLPPFVTPQFSFDPPVPNSRTFVSLRMKIFTGCLQQPTMTRSGNTFEVEWPHFPPGGGCGGAIFLHEHEVPLGTLPSGEYTVRIKFLSAPVLTKRLSVAEGAPRMKFVPPVVSTLGGPLKIYPAERRGVCFHNATVTIAGEVVHSTTENCSVTVTALPHEAGAVDLTVTTFEKTYVTRSTLRYADPSAAPDDEAFERILVPVLFAGAGQFGTKWVTEASVANRSHIPVMFDGSELRPRESLSLARFGNRPNGLLLFVPRDSVDALDFDAIVRDASREESSWGAEVPVVRERDLASTVLLENVPLDKRYRTTLRVYGVDQDDRSVTLKLHDANGAIVAYEALDVRRGAADEPAFAVADLNSLFRKFVGKGPFSIEVGEGLSHNRYWAFVSVTNNATQNVTIVTP